MLIPERVRLAVEYCEGRGATATIEGRSLRDDLAPQECPAADVFVGSPGLNLSGFSALHDGNGITVFGPSVSPATVVVRGANDADAVVLRLAGFVPDGNAWTRALPHYLPRAISREEREAAEQWIMARLA